MHYSTKEYEALSEASKTDASDCTISDQADSSRQNNEPQLEPFSWNFTPIRDKELKKAGWKRPKGSDTIIYAEPSQWVDMETGELFTKYQVRNLGIDITPSPSLRTIRAQSVVQPLPDEKRYFILYILGLRNTRGGLIIDLETAINRWIAWVYPHVDITDRSSKRKTLENWLYKYGILANRQTFATDFQFIAHSRKKDYIAEESLYFQRVPVLGKLDCGFAINPLTERKRLVEWINSKKVASGDAEKQ
ncbi:MULTISPECIES: hypothetical protein [Burkholderia]|uniref:hypothetical protein n=1 Tax=Burkholderia TaxID=32008 RepID=UPI0011774B5E|nr:MULTISPECIES: hypothetical protein [Burkholderia]EKS9798870.1 hypothetical protein [Burkholderia cepacia]EKS9805713.1 hypothetical protein [Burkholderia cepacia]EKS9814702.1 hypothetical protein [Burkholderia cepacia]EKS9820108.1 hypothetical protein [Burkholderia cepacia]EKS9828076.1 hypothetical protein [Burkholderia cepacia]